MTKEITITSSYKIKIDNYRNHQPIIYKEGGEEILTGKYKGQLTKPSWKPVDKYFRNVPQAVWWGVENMYISTEELESVGKNEMTLKEALQSFEKQVELLETILEEISK